MFFGYSLIPYGNYFIPVADPEKILIDMVYYHEFLPEETKEELLNVISTGLLDEYLSRPSQKMRARVVSTLGKEGKQESNRV